MSKHERSKLVAEPTETERRLAREICEKVLLDHPSGMDVDAAAQVIANYRPATPEPSQVEKLREALERIGYTGEHGEAALNGKSCRALARAALHPSPGEQIASGSGGQFKRGDRVEKISGSSWRGLVVGDYSTGLTPEGYAVESENEPGSVQLYPAKALRLAALSSPGEHGCRQAEVSEGGDATGDGDVASSERERIVALVRRIQAGETAGVKGEYRAGMNWLADRLVDAFKRPDHLGAADAGEGR